jgi:putative transcriptional regulator
VNTKAKTKTKRAAKKAALIPKRPTAGARIIEGLEQAIAWTKGDNDNVRVTLVHVPEIDVREVQDEDAVSQAQFATKFGFPPATLRNWEQGRSHPDAPTRACWRSSRSIRRRSRMCCERPVELRVRPALPRSPPAVCRGPMAATSGTPAMLCWRPGPGKYRCSLRPL